jgi:hypothetical protein
MSLGIMTLHTVGDTEVSDCPRNFGPLNRSEGAWMPPVGYWELTGSSIDGSWPIVLRGCADQ